MPYRYLACLLLALGLISGAQAQLSDVNEPLGDISFARFGGDYSLIHPADSRMDFGDTGTIEFWITWLPNGLDEPSCIVSHANPEQSRFSVCIDSKGESIGLLVDGKLHAVPADFTDGDPHFVVLTTRGDRTEVSVDGRFRGVIRKGYGAATHLPLVFGSHAGAGMPLVGSLGNLRIWRAALQEKTLQNFRFDAADRNPVSIVGHPQFHHLVAYSNFRDPRQPKAILRAPVDGFWVEFASREPEFLKLPNVASDSFAANNHGNYRKSTSYWLEMVDQIRWNVFRDGDYYGVLQHMKKQGQDSYRFYGERIVDDRAQDVTAEFTLRDGELICESAPTVLFGQPRGRRIRLTRPTWQDSVFREAVRANVRDAQFVGIAQNFSSNYRMYNMKKMDPFNLANSGSSINAFRRPQRRFKLSENNIYVPQEVIMRIRKEGGGGTESVLVQTQDELMETMSIRAGVHASGSVYGVGGGFKLNGKIDEETKAMRSNESMKLMAWAVMLKHDFVADFSRMELSDELRTQVKTLQEKGDYTAFFDEAGTHYAYSVSYGGLLFFESQFTKEAYSQSSMFGWDVEGEVSGSASYGPVGGSAGVSGGFGKGKTEGFSEMMETQKSQYWVVGGSGALAPMPENAQFEIGNEVAPVYLDLRPIHELLSPQYFSDPAIYITMRARMEREMNTYLGIVDSDERKGQEDPMIFARVEIDDMSITYPMTTTSHPKGSGRWVRVTANSTLGVYVHPGWDRIINAETGAKLGTQPLLQKTVKKIEGRARDAITTRIGQTGAFAVPASYFDGKDRVLWTLLDTRVWHADHADDVSTLNADHAFEGKWALPKPGKLDKPASHTVFVELRPRNQPQANRVGTASGTITYSHGYESEYLDSMRKRLKEVRERLQVDRFRTIDYMPRAITAPPLTEAKISGDITLADLEKQSASQTTTETTEPEAPAGPQSKQLWIAEPMVIGGTRYPAQPVIVSTYADRTELVIRDTRANETTLLVRNNGQITELLDPTTKKTWPMVGRSAKDRGPDGRPVTIIWNAEEKEASTDESSLRQIRAIVGELKRMDANKDGRLSRGEAAALGPRFDLWDTDKNGSVDMTEGETGVTAMITGNQQRLTSSAATGPKVSWRRLVIGGDWYDTQFDKDVAIDQDGDTLVVIIDGNPMDGAVTGDGIISVGDGTFSGSLSEDQFHIHLNGGLVWSRLIDGKPAPLPGAEAAEPETPAPVVIEPAKPQTQLYGNWIDIKMGLGIGIAQRDSTIIAKMESPEGQDLWRQLSGVIDGDSLTVRMPDGQERLVRIVDPDTLDWGDGLVWKRLPFWLNSTWIDPNGGTYRLEENREAVSIAIVRDDGVGEPVWAFRDGLTLELGEQKLQLNAARNQLRWPSGRVFYRVSDIAGIWMDAQTRSMLRITQDGFAATVSVERGDPGFETMTGKVVSGYFLRFEFQDGPVDVALSPDGDTLTWPGGQVWTRR